jgi:hypothetical protein
MNKRYLLLSGALAVSLAAGGTAIFAGYRHDEAQKAAHQKAVAAMVQKLKACPDKNDPVCLSPAQKSKLLASAISSQKLGDYEKAGLRYVELGRDDDALAMAKKCTEEGNSESEDRIMEALRIRADALGVSAEEDIVADFKACVPASRVEDIKRRAEQAEKTVQRANGQIEDLKKDLDACNTEHQEAQTEADQLKADAGKPAE